MMRTRLCSSPKKRPSNNSSTKFLLMFTIDSRFGENVTSINFGDKSVSMITSMPYSARAWSQQGGYVRCLQTGRLLHTQCECLHYNLVDLLLHLFPLTAELLGELQYELFLLEKLVHLPLLWVVDEVCLVLEDAPLVHSEIIESCSDQEVFMDVDFKRVELQSIQAYRPNQDILSQIELHASVSERILHVLAHYLGPRLSHSQDLVEIVGDAHVDRLREVDWLCDPVVW